MEMGLLRNVKRFARSYKLLIYFVGIILLVQALIAFNSHPNLLEEEKILRMRNLAIQRHRKQLALAGLKNDEGMLEKGKNGIDLYNPKDPRFRQQFNDHAKDSIDILEDHNLQLSENTLKKNYVVDDSYNNANDVNLYDEDLTEKENRPFSYNPECEISLSDAKSALSRATSNQCKQQIADTTCKMQNDTLFPKEMPRYCSHSGKYAFSAPKPKSFSQTLRPIRICYMLQVHGRAFRQFRRLFKVIYNKDHYYYIHVDKRSDYLLREVQKATEEYPNVKVASWRMATIWGGSSLLQMLLHAISDVLRFWKDWDFFINLSALDFPIESEENLVNFLATYHDKNFMKSHGRDDEKFIRKQGLNRVFVECDQHMWRLGDRELPKGITVNGGSDWVALNRGYCDYIINGNDQLLKDLKFWYKYTLLPAESFFHTLAQNSDRCETFVDNNLRVTNWNRARGCKCQYKHIVDWCGCSPNDFFPSDLGRLQTTRPVYFARKFEEVINQEVVNHLDFKIYGKYPTGTVGLSSYWENVYSHEDGPTSIGDEFLTHYSSFARMGLAQVGQNQDGKCQIEIKNLLEVELYKKEEIFEGYLITLDVKPSSNETISQPAPKLQIFVSRQNPLRIIDHSSELARRLESASIGTNWDIKELTLRDWGGIMGPNSALHLVAQWSHGEDDFVVTVVVIDPLNIVADYNDFRTPAKTAGVTDTPLSLRKPLRPGRWVVRFYVQREFTKICAELEFFVTPLQFKDSIESSREVAALNRGVVDDDQLNAANRNLFSIRTTLNLNKNNDALHLLQENSQQLSGSKLHSWIDSVLSGAWKAKDFCLASDSLKEWANFMPKHCQRRTLFNLCSNMNWSSFSPDPKSELTHIKPDGRIR